MEGEAAPALNPDITLWSLIVDADPVVKAVMLVLAIASLWTWAVAVDKWLHFGEIEGKARAFEKVFWSGQSLEELDDRYSDRPRDAFARVFAASAREWRDLRRGGQISPAAADLMIDRCDRLMQAQIARELERAGRGFGVLASVGSAGPFIGLFGTVWGIMNAFTSIANEQQTSVAVVAPGISEALLATALGLLAAVPAVIFYNKFTGDLDRFADRLEGFADEVLARLSRRLGERV
ncbi:MAG: protein TolQ [Alphaproteobacteria bacterium]|nr:protein TolQ [Alphaproteobacteria bacterium]